MKMVPACALNVELKGERRVFELLQDINLSQRDVAFHSLNIDSHDKKVWAEIDFLVVSERGILAIEVKGWRGSYDPSKGTWTYSEGEDSFTKTESPVVQAKDGYYALWNKWLAPKFRRSIISSREYIKFTIELR